LARILESEFRNESSGHDWWHIYRVWNLAKRIAVKENAELYIVELASLLHDVDDWKFADHNGPSKTIKLLESVGVDNETIELVTEIISSVSFKGAGVETIPQTIEGKIVQDADRLDAIGAIGIARTFAYGGFKGRNIYNPDVEPILHSSFDDYKKSASHTINHFYEKLLLLRDRMNTQTGKELAAKRHLFMETYLEQFYSEWNANS